MTSRFYGSLVSPANTAVAAPKSDALRISIGWWLVPSAMTYLALIVIFR